MKKINRTILYKEDEWRNSVLSIARHYGGINIDGHPYIIVNDKGEDLFQCTAEARKRGGQYAIEPGEPADLIDSQYQETYRKVGRDRFIQALLAGCRTKKEIEAYCNADRTNKTQNNV